MLATVNDFLWGQVLIVVLSLLCWLWQRHKLLLGGSRVFLDPVSRALRLSDSDEPPCEPLTQPPVDSRPSVSMDLNRAKARSAQLQNALDLETRTNKAKAALPPAKPTTALQTRSTNVQVVDECMCSRLQLSRATSHRPNALANPAGNRVAAYLKAIKR